jgi:predicted RNA binding protein YcfA (HicA-like mRNA interferase family)
VFLDSTTLAAIEAQTERLRALCELLGAGAGVDVRTVAGRLGHARTSTTLDRYAAFIPARDQDAADIIGRFVGYFRADGGDGMNAFPSMKAKDLLAVLQRPPLNYRLERRRGSHRILVSDRHPTIVFAFHDGVTVGPALVKRVLVTQVGLAADEARGLL